MSVARLNSPRTIKRARTRTCVHDGGYLDKNANASTVPVNCPVARLLAVESTKSPEARASTTITRREHPSLSIINFFQRRGCYYVSLTFRELNKPRDIFSSHECLSFSFSLSHLAPVNSVENRYAARARLQFYPIKDRISRNKVSKLLSFSIFMKPARYYPARGQFPEYFSILHRAVIVDVVYISLRHCHFFFSPSSLITSFRNKRAARAHTHTCVHLHE